MKKALVISGGGSKGAFAAGVAQYLMKEEEKEYDLFLGTSTESLMVSHLALGKLDALKKLYTNVDKKSIFSNSPFTIRKIAGEKVISINHLNTLWNFIKGRKRLVKVKIYENSSKKILHEKCTIQLETIIRKWWYRFLI